MGSTQQLDSADTQLNNTNVLASGSVCFMWLLNGFQRCEDTTAVVEGNLCSDFPKRQVTFLLIRAN